MLITIGKMRAKRNVVSLRRENKCLKICSDETKGVSRLDIYVGSSMVVCVFMGKRYILNYQNVPRTSCSFIFVERSVLFQSNFPDKISRLSRRMHRL